MKQPAQLPAAAISHPPPPFAAAGTRWCPYTGGGPGAARPGHGANLRAALGRGAGKVVSAGFCRVERLVCYAIRSNVSK